MANSERVVATYSIVACDLDAGQWGVATQSKFLAVGSVVPWAEPHVGAVATQSYANPRSGPDGLALIRQGMPRRGRSDHRATMGASIVSPVLSTAAPRSDTGSEPHGR